jgi:YgiT-type zinc finger domain-containing protein
MSNAITTCIVCQSAQIKKKRGSFPVTCHDKTVEVPGIESYHCSQCGETFLDLDNETKIDAYLKSQRTQRATASVK